MADKNGYIFGPSEKYISAEECIDYSLKKIQDEYRNVKISPISKKKIIQRYNYYCTFFSINFVKGYLDSFEMAACLLNSILKTKILFYGDRQNLDIPKVIFFKNFIEETGYQPNDFLKNIFALNAAFKMCENPIFYKGDNGTKEINMQKFELNKFQEQYSEEWEDIERRLLVICEYGDVNRNTTLQAYLMFKFLYHYVVEKLNNKEKAFGMTYEEFQKMYDETNHFADSEELDLAVASFANEEQPKQLVKKPKKDGKGQQ